MGSITLDTTAAEIGDPLLRVIPRRDSTSEARYAETHGALAEWLRSGLQSRLHRFDSGRRLYWAYGGNRAGVEHPFDHRAKAEAANGGDKLVERRLSEVHLGRRNLGVAQ
jgi:hypothetical protein